MHAQIPSPPRLPLVGNLLQIPRGGLTRHLTGLASGFDGIFMLDFAGYPAYFVTSAALTAELCDEKRFRKSVGPPLTILRELAGDGLFTARSDEPNWAKAHRILVPAFGQRARRAYFNPMVEVGMQLVRHWERAADQGRPVTVSDDMTRLTLDTIALCGFGFRFDSFASPALHPFLQQMVRVLDETMGRLTRMHWINRLRLGANRRWRQDIGAMHALVDEVIRQRRANPGDTRDLLGLMLDAVDPVTREGLDDENIRHQVITFLIAGHETTSGLLTFAIHLLIAHPDVLAQARAEADAVFGNGDAPVVDDLARLTVIDRVLKEALRLWPTAPAFAVAPIEDTTIGGRYRIASHQRLTVVLTALHRDPAVWRDPERFDIDRFLPENEAKIPPHAYKPFGNGSRACIGRQFAIMEAKIALGLLLQRFDFMDVDRYTLRLRETLTLKPDEFRIGLRRRS